MSSIIQSFDLTYQKYNSDKYPNGATQGFNPDLIGYIFDNGTYRTIFYDGLNKSQLDIIQTTTPLQTILTEVNDTGFVSGLVQVNFIKINNTKQPLLHVNNNAVKTITGATNANPIVITSATHGYVTGNRVRITGVVGNTAANGLFTVTRINANTYSIPVAGNGGYTSGGTSQLYTFVDEYQFGVVNSSRVANTSRVLNPDGSFKGTLLTLQFQRTRYVYNRTVLITQDWSNSVPPVVSVLH